MVSTSTSESFSAPKNEATAITKEELASFRAKRDRWMSSPRKKLIPLPPPSPKIVPPASFGSPLMLKLTSPPSDVVSSSLASTSNVQPSTAAAADINSASGLFGNISLSAGSSVNSSFGTPPPSSTSLFGVPSATFSKISTPIATNASGYKLSNATGPSKQGTSAAAVFPPSSTKAPTPFGQMNSSTLAASAAFPPSSTKAPTPFGQMNSPTPAASAVFPPSSNKAPTPFGQMNSPTPAASAVFPPSSTKAPTPFGQMNSPTPAAAAAAFQSKDPASFGATLKTTNETDYKTRLNKFYQKYNPSKLYIVEATLIKYKGNEEELFQKLQAKYEGTSSKASSSAFPEPCGQGPLCFLKFLVDGQPVGRVIVKVYLDKTPLAAENFKCLCTGEKGMGRLGKPLCYKSSRVHRIVPGFCVQMGDFTKGNGTGGESIYPPNSEHGDAWGKFKDELFMQHSKAGLLSMANSGKNTNSSQVFFTLKPVPYLDGKHVVFGEVVEGMDVIEKIANLKTDAKQNPTQPVVISECGEVKDAKEIPSKQAMQSSPFGVLGASGSPAGTSTLNGYTESSIFGASNTSAASTRPSLSFGSAPSSVLGSQTSSGASPFSFSCNITNKTPFSFGSVSGTPAFGSQLDIK
ncbi:cyclophilin type peptidyl-prolyl cis-trans isomerase [Nitzschia inconspicua]|uniref:peptidylprolyl isomerase n=1 Tax=Nitzschia inconspicua TaxID=303405 RepID=A0A9K3LX30_9STRA|nr:cyclophilin type peptidyl-prolyl cis-trans isomerase [Nitzschia inconspicua]